MSPLRRAAASLNESFAAGERAVMRGGASRRRRRDAASVGPAAAPTGRRLGRSA